MYIKHLCLFVLIMELLIVMKYLYLKTMRVTYLYFLIGMYVHVYAGDVYKYIRKYSKDSIHICFSEIQNKSINEEKKHGCRNDIIFLCLMLESRT